MTDRGQQASIRSDWSSPDGHRPLQPGSNPAELVERIEKLAGLLATAVQETVAARREAARLRSQNATLQRRVDELGSQFQISGDTRRRDA